jgi:hypothetical protein
MSRHVNSNLKYVMFPKCVLCNFAQLSLLALIGGGGGDITMKINENQYLTDNIRAEHSSICMEGQRKSTKISVRRAGLWAKRPPEYEARVQTTQLQHSLVCNTEYLVSKHCWPTCAV